MINNENYMYNNKVKIILICILILDIALMGVLVYQYSNQEKNSPKLSSGNSSENVFGCNNAKEILSVTLKTDNLSSGEISSQIEDFATKFLPFINQNFIQTNSKNIEDFYKENKYYVKQYGGIENEKELTEFCNKVKNVKCNLDEISKASYIENTAEYSNNIFKVNVKLIDKENNYITVKVSNNTDEGNLFKYDILDE